MHAVLVVYWTETNHTRTLAEFIAKGVETTSAQARVLPTAKVNVQQDILEWADAVVIGSPTHYGNVASGLLSWVEKEWEGFWTDPRFDDKFGAVFATGGGLNQGLEHVLSSLQRLLMSFRVSLIAPDPSRSGYSSYGAVAVTGSPPFNLTGSAIAKPFEDAAMDFGQRIGAKACRKT